MVVQNTPDPAGMGFPSFGRFLATRDTLDDPDHIHIHVVHP